MKRFFLFGLPTLVILAAIGWYAVTHHHSVEKETSGFVTDAANAITESWDASELVSRADPGLIRAMDTQGQSVLQLFQIYSTIGRRTKDMECTFKDSATLGSEDKEYVTASYDCKGEFETGPATMLLTVRKAATQSDWQIYYIKIASEHFKG